MQRGGREAGVRQGGRGRQGGPVGGGGWRQGGSRDTAEGSREAAARQQRGSRVQ